MPLHTLPAQPNRALLARRRGGLAAWQQRLDRTLLDAVPWVGRYGWETVIVLAR